MNVIEVENVSKVYRLYDSPRYRLREIFSPSGKQFHRKFYAVSDISLNIESGQTVGIIGQNGSGKSTLLKIICGVLQQSSGSVLIHGRISALLELGFGFDPEFTGRENLYLNGALAGFTREQMKPRLPDIEAFADIGEFIDHPVRTYSAGMFLRLAFAAATNIDPEILVVDEALAVGDLFFQHKCYSKLESFQAEGKTILLVAHDLNLIKNFCTTAILLDEGKIVDRGEPDYIAEQYISLMKQKQSEHASNIFRVTQKTRSAISGAKASFGSEAGQIVDVKILDTGGKQTVALQAGDTIVIKIQAIVVPGLKNPNIGFMLRDNRGFNIFGTNTVDLGLRLKLDENHQTTVYFTLSPLLTARSYSLAVWLSCEASHGAPILIDKQVGVGVFQIIGDGRPTSGVVDLQAKVQHNLPEVEKHEKRKLGDYGHIWDNYVIQKFPEIKSGTPYSKKQLELWQVLNIKDEEYQWPGDEWGDRETAARLLDRALATSLNDNVRYMCELGAGAGRYTVLAFEKYRDVSILSFDVSREFEKALRERCKEFVESGRLKTYLLDKNPQFFINTVMQANMLGKIDAIYSIDAMVHVDLHTLFVYWLSSTRILRPGGVLAMSVATPCNEKGFMKLLHDAPSAYALGGNAGEQFMWISWEIVESLLSRLGFDVNRLKDNGRDLFFSARLVDPDRSTGWLKKAGANSLAIEVAEDFIRRTG